MHIPQSKNIAILGVEHNSYNDVIAIVNLLKGVDFPQEALKEPPIKPEAKYNHLKNDQRDYQYDVKNGMFHKREGPNISEGVDMLGYSTLRIAFAKNISHVPVFEKNIGKQNEKR